MIKREQYNKETDARLLKVMQDVLVVLRGADLTAFECGLTLDGLRSSIFASAQELNVNDLQVEPSF